MTKQEWIDAEKKIDFWNWIELDCDGYKINFHESRIKSKIVISLYVNGEIKGEWFNKDCEERKRFYQEHKSRFYKSRLQEARMRKLAKNVGHEFRSHYSYWTMHWSSFKSLKAHLIKNNKEIKWLNEEEWVKQ